MPVFHYDAKTRFYLFWTLLTKKGSPVKMAMAGANSCAWSGARVGFPQVCVASDADGRDPNRKSPLTVLRNVENQDPWT